MFFLTKSYGFHFNSCMFSSMSNALILNLIIFNIYKDFTSRCFFLFGTCFGKPCFPFLSLPDFESCEVFLCWLAAAVVSCWPLVLYIGIIVCDCGVRISILCIFYVECFENCVVFCIDLYLFLSLIHI